jgi:SAM-dependent methyltransferase
MIYDTLNRARKDLAPIVRVYQRRLAKYGSGPRGVYWINRERQLLRFEILAGILDGEADLANITVNDLGCGYGALFEFLRDLPALQQGQYFGYDMCPEMVAAAKARIGDPRAHIHHAVTATRQADYSFVSGTYNLKLKADERSWTKYVKASLEQLWEKTQRGLAFNMLTTPQYDAAEEFYRAEASEYADFCRRKLSANVTVVEDYPLPDWTILVRR